MRRVIVGIAVVASMLGFFSVGPSEAATPRATATPTSGLVDAQTVTVSWHGFKPGPAKYGLAIIECLPGSPLSGSTCDQIHPYTFIPRPIPRSGSRSFTVHSGMLGVREGSCGVSPESNNCVILVAEIDKHDDLVPGFWVQIPISFDLSQTTPSVAADPTTGLTDRANVHLVGSHFSATQTDAFYQCVGNYTTVGFDACGSGEAGRTGDFDIQFPVHQGVVKTWGEGSMTCGTSDADNNCVIAVIPAGNGWFDWTNAIFIPITFALPGGG